MAPNLSLRRVTEPKLIYFDAPVSRGEDCRLALHVAGVDFEDVRLKREEWMAFKPTAPFGAVPVLEMLGQPPLAQSNAILVLIGRLHGLHPQDNFEAARHEAMMGFVRRPPRRRIAVAPHDGRGREEEGARGTGRDVPPHVGGKRGKTNRRQALLRRVEAPGGVHDAVGDDAHVKAWNAKS
jgi:glutathione S-transferase